MMNIFDTPHKVDIAVDKSLGRGRSRSSALRPPDDFSHEEALRQVEKQLAGRSVEADAMVAQNLGELLEKQVR